ncbi:hypothetical protein ACFVYA_31155 [Amycolatopsis sp. NPDC058278]|uniref:hypothetical protein n=1 Tax=Amycolatopsis sp. NPDC058278 TaxID=3346417 RepID=UPI0036DEB811
MTSKVFPLRYWLPITRFTVTVSRRLEIVPKEVEVDGRIRSESFLEPVSEVTIAPGIAADHRAACTTTVDVDFLESASMSVTLDDNGVITSVGTESGRDLSPVISLVAKVVPVLAAFSLEPVALEKSLDERWRGRFEEQDTLITVLSERMAALLGELAAATPVQITEIGAALDVLERELGALDRMRREWIVGQAKSEPAITCEFAPSDLYRPETDDLRDELDAGIEIPAAQMTLAGQAGVLVALAGRRAMAATSAASDDLELVDALVFRRPRPMSLGVYTRTEAGAPWRLDRATVRELDVVDEYSQQDQICFNSALARKNNVDVTFHADGSINTYSIKSAPMFSELATAAGSVLDAVAAARKAQLEKPDAVKKALDEAQTKLGLLKTSTEYAQLAATHGRAAELAELEQQVKLAEQLAKLGAA